MQFRKDINGLRAIAVIAVVLFHFNASWMPGGFAGVDVFFVISGFLMTGIIFRGIEQENFSILKFYVARANRIIPALAVLCLVLLVFGYFYFTPLEYQALAKHVGSSMGFLSNVIYWRESGYFDAASHEKWLLHTWSLSAEWQFYIIYPLVLVAMRKFMSLKAMKATVLVGTVLGFIFCVVATYKWPNPAYYLLPTRAWEMMIGGVAYLYPLKIVENRKKVFEWVGLALIIFSYIFISKENLWPGYLALIPVIGAFLLIQAQRNDSFLTGNILFQVIGKWSYSIYLWHWPIVVAIYYFSLDEVFMYLGVALSIFLGFFSNKYIETVNFGNDFDKKIKYIFCKPFIISVMFGLVSISIFIDFRIKLNEVPSFYRMATYQSGYCFGSPGSNKSNKSFLECYLGDKEKAHKALLFGDSFAGQYEPMLNQVFNKMSMSIHSITTNSCYPSLGVNFHHSSSHVGYKQCLMNRNYVKDNIDKYDVIFISSRWDEYYKDNRDSISEVKEWIDFAIERGATVFYLPNPTVYKKNIGNDFISSIIGNYDFVSDFALNYESNQYTENKEKELESYYKNTDDFIFIEKSDLFNGNTFPYKGRLTPYSADGGHISELASNHISKDFYNTKAYSKLLMLLNN